VDEVTVETIERHRTMQRLKVGDERTEAVRYRFRVVIDVFVGHKKTANCHGLGSSLRCNQRPTISVSSFPRRNTTEEDEDKSQRDNDPGRTNKKTVLASVPLKGMRNQPHVPNQPCEPFQCVQLSAVNEEILGVAVECSAEVGSDSSCCCEPEDPGEDEAVWKRERCG